MLIQHNALIALLGVKALGQLWADSSLFTGLLPQSLLSCVWKE